jgi:hypothetical protein
VVLPHHGEVERRLACEADAKHQRGDRKDGKNECRTRCQRGLPRRL